LNELQSAIEVEITTVGDLKSRVQSLISKSSDYDGEEATIVREQARAIVGTSKIKQ
jgi:hypothetical protein